jgi:acetyltransferase
MGAKTVQPGVELMNQAGISTSAYPEPAARSLATLAQYSRLTDQEQSPVLSYNDVDQQAVQQIFDRAAEQGQTAFPEAQAMKIMRAYNFPLLQSKVASSPQEAVEIAQEIGGKLAMKIVSDDILHKSDVGGVMLNVTAETVRAKFEQMMTAVQANKPEAELDGVLLMEMAPDNGTEVILGVTKAPGLGTMIMFGLGGIYVEVLKDVNFAYTPLAKKDAERMVRSLKTAELFDGVRGEKPRDVSALIECIGRLSQLVNDFPQIKELDINPLLSLPQGQGAKVLDVRVVLDDETE